MRAIVLRHWGWALTAAAALHVGGALLLAAGAPRSEFSGGHDRVLAVSLSGAGAETPASPEPTQTAARRPQRALAAPPMPPAKAAAGRAPATSAVDTTTPPAPAADAAAKELRAVAPARAAAGAAAPEAVDVASPPAPLAPSEPASAGSGIAVGAVAPPARSSSATSRPGDAVYDDYVGRIRRQLEASKRYPRRARQQRLEGTVLLEFAIDRSGAVTRHRIVASAGHAALDAAVERMLRHASPLPAMPPELPGPGLELRIPVVFDLR